MDRFANLCIGVGIGLFICTTMLICCETRYIDKTDIVDKHKTFKYNDRVYRTVIDTVLTDSLHKWK